MILGNREWIIDVEPSPPHFEVREGPDAMSDVEELCPDHGAHTFKTSCGVTRCLYCGKVAG
jgi:hypothetical protein